MIKWRGFFYKNQELHNDYKHMVSPPGALGVRFAYRFSFLCYASVLIVFVLCLVPDVGCVLFPILAVSFSRCWLCLVLDVGCVLFPMLAVSCFRCWLCLWIAHYWLSIRFSFTFSLTNDILKYINMIKNYFYLQLKL